MFKPQFKILTAFLLGLVLTFISIFIITFSNSNYDMPSSFTVFALFFTYEYFLINLVKGDYLTKEREEIEDKTYDEYMRFSSYCYRRVIKVFLAICIIMMPIMWGLSIMEFASII